MPEDQPSFFSMEMPPAAVRVLAIAALLLFGGEVYASVQAQRTIAAVDRAEAASERIDKEATAYLVSARSFKTRSVDFKSADERFQFSRWLVATNRRTEPLDDTEPASMKSWAKELLKRAMRAPKWLDDRGDPWQPEVTLIPFFRAENVRDGMGILFVFVNARAEISVDGQRIDSLQDPNAGGVTLMQDQQLPGGFHQVQVSPINHPEQTWMKAVPVVERTMTTVRVTPPP